MDQFIVRSNQFSLIVELISFTMIKMLKFIQILMKPIVN
jgi:hypothetical protein